MPVRTLEQLGVSYYLLAFDSEGRERADDPDGSGGVLSARILKALAQRPATDVFLLAHGWKGDVPRSAAQYDRWISAMWALSADRERLERRPGGFAPMWIGLHWPSQPWGDEDLGRAGPESGGAKAPPYATAGVGQTFGSADERSAFVDEWASRLGDSDAVRAALEVIAAEARHAPLPPGLSSALRDAYVALDRALGLGADGVGAAPGDDREPFDPDAALAAEAVLAGPGARGTADILGPLRQLSFWTMKKRARVVGESGMHAFVRALRSVIPAGRETRLHLMGHSFGTIVSCAVVAGPGGASPLPFPVHSLMLVQGAMSLWSFAAAIPVAPGKSGYFHRIGLNGSVAGPIVTTRSRHDAALGRFYPIAAGVARDLTVAPPEYPRYGALGAFGAQGLDQGVVDGPMLGIDGSYRFVPGGVHNLEASDVIRDGGGLAGAHSDIFDPEVAHAVWEAALAGEAQG